MRRAGARRSAMIWNTSGEKPEPTPAYSVSTTTRSVPVYARSTRASSHAAHTVDAHVQHRHRHAHRCGHARPEPIFDPIEVDPTRRKDDREQLSELGESEHRRAPSTGQASEAHDLEPCKIVQGHSKGRWGAKHRPETASPLRKDTRAPDRSATPASRITHAATVPRAPVRAAQGRRVPDPCPAA